MIAPIPTTSTFHPVIARRSIHSSPARPSPVITDDELSPRVVAAGVPLTSAREMTTSSTMGNSDDDVPSMPPPMQPPRQMMTRSYRQAPPVMPKPIVSIVTPTSKVTFDSHIRTFDHHSPSVDNHDEHTAESAMTSHTSTITTTTMEIGEDESHASYYLHTPSTSQMGVETPSDMRSLISTSMASRVRSPSANGRSRHRNDRAYCIAHELLMTERTYVQQLKQLVNIVRPTFRKECLRDSHLLDDAFSTIEPIYDFHVTLLLELQAKLDSWTLDEDGDVQHRLGDSLLSASHNTVNNYRHLMTSLLVHLACLDQLVKTRPNVRAFVDTYEANAQCNLFRLFMQPVYRVRAIADLVLRLTSFYEADDPECSTDYTDDLNDCRMAYEAYNRLSTQVGATVDSLDNFVKLVEVERQLLHVQNVQTPKRGTLNRFTRRGSQQRLFVLFNDCLIYATRMTSNDVMFALHAQLPLDKVTVSDGDALHLGGGMANTFTLECKDKTYILSAADEAEKTMWLDDIRNAKEMLGEDEDVKLIYCSSQSATPLSSVDVTSPPSSSVCASTPRSNDDTMHVCWHRTTTLGIEQLRNGGRRQMSGYLMRKFRNSSGWQKLWVVYTHFCLHFHKSHTEESWLASLALLGYTIDEEIDQEHVFKLSYKSHSYYLKAESEYMFQRWVGVIRSATQSTSTVRE